jgi:small-conductance mechanosensitive channel
MSDAAITVMAASAVSIVTTIVAFFTLWIKLRYGVEKAEEAASRAHEVEGHIKKVDSAVLSVEGKLDANTAISTQARESSAVAASKASAAEPVIRQIEKQTNGTLDAQAHQLSVNTQKIAALEIKLESLDKNLTSTRHELRGHLQTIMTTLALIKANTGTSSVQPVVLPVSPKPPPLSGEGGPS